MTIGGRSVVRGSGTTGTAGWSTTWGILGMAHPPASSGPPTIPTVRQRSTGSRASIGSSRTRECLERRIQPTVRSRTFQRSVHWQCWKEPLDDRLGRPRDDASRRLRWDGRRGCSRPIHYQRPRSRRGQFSAAGGTPRSAQSSSIRSECRRGARALVSSLTTADGVHRQSVAPHRRATRQWNSDATRELERRGIERADRSWWRAVDSADVPLTPQDRGGGGDGAFRPHCKTTYIARARSFPRAPRCHAPHTRAEPLKSSTMVGPFSHAAIVL